MKLRGLLVVVMVLVLAQSAMAGWFDYSEEDIAVVNQTYFGNEAPVIENFIGLNLSTIANARDAKILYSQLDPMVENLSAALGMMRDEMKAKKPEVEHLFDTLYTKEIHDELWAQTFPIRQAAYNKALTEYNAMFIQIRTKGTLALQADAIAKSLKKIGNQFKEIKAEL